MADSVLNSHKEKEQMRYTVGDKVVIKSREWYDKNKDEYGIITFSTESGDYCFTKEDECFCGRVVTIGYEGKGYYCIDEDDRGCFWIDEMIEGLSTSKCNEGDSVGVSANLYSCQTTVRIKEVRWDRGSYRYKAYIDGEEEWLYDDDIAYENFRISDNPKPSLNNFMDMLDNEIKLPYGYVFKDENGNVINTAKITIEKKKEEYPNT